MLEMHQNLRKLRKKFISKQSSVLKGGTTLNPSTFGGYWTIVPQNNGLFEMFWSCLGLLNDRCWNVIFEMKM